MSLLPIAAVVIAFFFLFKVLGGKDEKSEQLQPPPDRHSPEPAHRQGPIDGPAPFHFVEGKLKPTPSTSPRGHPCRVCGVPSAKRCLRWSTAHRQVYVLISMLYASNGEGPKYKRIGGHINRTVYPAWPVVVHPQGRALSQALKSALGAFNRETQSRSQPTSSVLTRMRRGLYKSPVRYEYAQWPALGYVGVHRATPSPTAPLLGNKLSLFFHEFGLLDRQRPNRCVERLVGGAGVAYQQWVGDIMLFREEVPDRYCDVTEEDLLPAIEYFRDYGRL
ncbi:hypothetical protein B0F90DRAFT_1667403 [Multifurca ochricompacta]|uniref:Uncharacterized protein n=1 Tax=Multifurca ochricompacta TaxID=376703 RepID=A0AAD4QM61_9AGAM|nr:hypothetical protein B0F90DRAFT_1667403 [Multifurca ochricompacta]